MTQVVTVHTDFTDLNSMAQGLVGRVNDTHVILPGPEPVDVGEWVQFAVTLYDGTPGFAGVGRCVTVVDNGEERLSHQRFDVVIDSLQFDSRGQQVFEHILTLNGAGGGELEGEAGYAQPGEDNSFEDVSAEFTASKIELPTEALHDSDDDEATMIGESPAGLASVRAAGYTQEDDEDDVFDQDTPVPPRPQAVVPSLAPAFSEPPAMPPAAAMASVPPSMPPPVVHTQANGASFSYPDGLPFPAQPPRPQLEPSQRVSKAPRPRPQ
jgi:hypothetical protein